MIVRVLREKKGITQQNVADACGVCRQTIQAIESGTNHPSIKLAKKLAMFFDVQWTIFFDDMAN